MSPSRRRILSPLAGFSAMLCLLVFPETVSSAALDAMTLAVKRLIPLLFPYSVLSNLMLRRGWIPVRGPLSALYGLPGVCEGALFSGIAAGFPVGAAGASSLYRSGRIDAEDAALLAAVSSVPSPAFLAGAVGVMWGDVRFGWFLWIAANLTLLLFSRTSARKRKPETVHTVPVLPKESFSRDFSRAVTESASSCLAVTAFIVFFRILSSVGSRLLPPAGILFSLFLEFSSGARTGAAVGGIKGAAMTGAAVGFGGVSVMAQIAAQIPDETGGFSLKPYIISRILLTLILPAASALWASFFPLTAAEPAISEPHVPLYALLSVPALLCLLASGRRDSGEYFSARS